MWPGLASSSGTGPGMSRRSTRASRSEVRWRPQSSRSARSRRAPGGTGTMPSRRSSSSSGAGRLTARRRVSDFARVYDLPERVLPAAVLAAPTPTEAAARKELLVMGARSLGVATLTDLAHYYDQPCPWCGRSWRSSSRRVGCCPSRWRAGGRRATSCPARACRVAIRSGPPLTFRLAAGTATAGRTALRLPLPHRDLHAGAEADVRLLRPTVPPR